MSHLPQFDRANDLLHTSFRYRLDPNRADAFRARLRQIGWQRFNQAVKLTIADRPQDVQEAHCLLEQHMWQLIPPRPATRPLRSPQAQVARAISAAMDARVMELVGDERQ